MCEEVEIVVGLPFLTSTSSLRFWITLCDAWSVEGVSTLVEKFQQEEGNGKIGMRHFVRDWNSHLIDKVAFFCIIPTHHVL